MWWSGSEIINNSGSIQISVKAGKPYLRHPYVITDADIRNAITFELPVEEICFLVDRARDIHPRCLPLVPAVAMGSCELVELMLKMGADVNQREERDTGLRNSSALLQALLRKNEPMIALLLSQADIDVNRAWETLREFHKYTPLMLAAEQGLEGVVHQLLAKGANADCINAKGKTALEIATAKGFNGIVKMLMEATGHSAIQVPSAWEKAAVAAPHHLQAAIILLAKDDQGQIKIVTIEKNLIQAEIITSFPFDPEKDAEILKNLSDFPQVKVVSKGKLLECGFQYGPSHTYYGCQLYFIEVSTESLKFLTTEMPDIISVEDLQQPQAKKDRSHPFSAAERAISAYLQPLGKEEGERFCIAAAGREQVERALMVYLKVGIELRQAIDTRNIEAIQDFLKAYPDVCLDEFILPGEYPASSQDDYRIIVRVVEGARVVPVTLAYQVGFMEGILAFLKGGNIHDLRGYAYHLLEAIVRQDDLEAFLEAIGQPQQEDLKLSVEAAVSASAIAGWGKEAFEKVSSYYLPGWVSKQTVAAHKIAEWCLQHSKEKFSGGKPSEDRKQKAEAQAVGESVDKEKKKTAEGEQQPEAGVIGEPIASRAQNVVQALQVQGVEQDKAAEGEPRSFFREFNFLFSSAALSTPTEDLSGRARKAQQLGYKDQQAEQGE